MADYQYNLTPDNVTLALWITADSYPTTGRTPTVSIKNLETSGSYLDFNDNTFKIVGWTTRYQNLTSAIDGLYNFTWIPTGLITSNTTFEAIYYNTAGATTTAQVASDTLRFFNLSPSVSVAGGGGGSTVVQGVWTKKEKEKLFDTLSGIESNIDKLIGQTKEDLQKELLTIKG